VLFIIYALLVYHYRRRAIVNREINGYYNDKFGPSVIVVLILLFLITVIVFELYFTVPPVISTAYVRDYRIPLTSTFLLSPDLTLSGLTELKSAIQNQLSRFTLEGNFQFQSTENINWFDSRGSCLLRRNGYTFRKTTKQNSDGMDIISSTLQYRTVDWVNINQLDINFKTTLFSSSVIIQPPDEFLYSREITKPYFPSSLTFQNIVKNFNTFFLWNSIPPSNWETSIEPINSQPLQLYYYSGVKTTFQSSESSSKIATLGLYVWYLPDYTPVWGELSVSIPINPGQELTNQELIDSKYFYDKLKFLPTYLNGTSSSHLTDAIYALSPTYC